MNGRLLLIPSLLVLLAGCATEPTQPPMGQSVRRAVQAQILNPEAGGAEPVAGLDGPVGQQVMQGYRDSFKAAEKKESKTELIGVDLGGGKK
jgi:uncharacterized protein YceK